MNIKEAIKAPTIIERTHESVLKAGYTIQIVKTMLERKDSHETILEIMAAIYEQAPNSITER